MARTSFIFFPTVLLAAVLVAQAAGSGPSAAGSSTHEAGGVLQLSGISLSGVTRSGRRVRALLSVNQQPAREFQVGETVLGARIVRIRDDNVTFEDSRGRHTVWMNDDATHAATISRPAPAAEPVSGPPATDPNPAGGGVSTTELLEQAAQRKSLREKNSD